MKFTTQLLLIMVKLKKIFKNAPVGLSDHSLGIHGSLAAVSLGANIIEKHFTLRRADGGVDSTFSMEPEEMKALVTESERAWQGLGEVDYGASPAEKGSMVFRRSLYIVEDVKKGDVLDSKNLRAIRPGMGLATKYIDVFLGKRVSKDITRGTPVSWDLIT